MPDTFLTTTDLKTILDQQAVTVILAFGFVIRLCAGAFDLSIGATMGFSAILAAWLLGIHGAPVGVAVGAALGAVLLVGILNAILVTFFKIESFIATLAMSSILAAMTAWVSGAQDITGLAPGFQDIAINQIFGLQMIFYCLIALALPAWYVLGYPAGVVPLCDRRRQRRGSPVGGPDHGDDLRLARGLRPDRQLRQDARRRRPWRRHPDPRPPGPDPGLLGGLPRLDPDQARPLQRMGHGARRLRAGHRRQGAAAGGRPVLDPGTLQRPGAAVAGRDRRAGQAPPLPAAAQTRRRRGAGDDALTGEAGGGLDRGSERESGRHSGRRSGAGGAAPGGQGGDGPIRSARSARPDCIFTDGAALARSAYTRKGTS